ncbi:MAG TPA: prepilin peptidase [Microbacteriaceae bacterium]|nr:prepilin peptidase [Microbacteriaceae bacterium]
MAAVLVGVFGSLIGSFLNVVVYRVPLKRSVVSPPSACTDCGARIKGYDNIPVLSWLVLRGKCRNCGSAISARYPIVELATGLFFAAVTVWFASVRVSIRPWSTVPTGLAGELELLAFLYLAAVSIALALIDLDTHTLPNRIVMPSYVVGVALLAAAGILSGDYGALLRAAIGMASLWLSYLLMALAYPGGMGFGDVKLAGVLGLFLGYLGWSQLAVGAFAAFVLGGLFSLVLLVTRKANRKSGIPFGPWMLGGAWVGALLGEPLLHGYLAVFGLA